MIQAFGATKRPIILKEGRLVLTCKRPSYQPTGTCRSPRSVLAWRSLERKPPILSRLTKRLTRCTHSSLTGSSAPHHWAATGGKRYLVQKIPCSSTVTGRALMHTVAIPRQESVFLVTTKTTATPVTLSLGLVPKTQQKVARVEIGTSKSWVISWFSDTRVLLILHSCGTCS